MKSIIPARSKSIAGVFAVALAVLASSALAQTKAAKPDVTKGQAIAAKVCATCHAPDGNSTISANPKLAGQFPEYLRKQLTQFKANGARKSAVMMGMVASLSEDDIRDVSAYYATQKPRDGAARNAATVSLGQKVYRGGDVSKGLAACAGCHGATGSGIPAQYPRLAGQHADYTEAQ